MAHSAGSNIGPYRIIEPIGRGGMASVFKAYEPSLDRYVALKILPPEFLHDPTFANRFRREAQTIARLEHPQIIPIFAYDIDVTSGTPWMAMRLISGGSLSQRIRRGRLAPSECARILEDVAEALDYAHAAGVIHRDVKPQNVLLDEAGRVYLADFGIAKMVEASPHMTQTGMITGTPQYMAPEQALGKAIGKSIDIYALGIVAYELFTGRVPFSADTPVAVLMKQTSEPMPLPPVSEVREEVTRAILRATAKDPGGRWPSAGGFAKAVTSAVTAVDPVVATSVMPALGDEAVQAMTLPNAPVTERARSSRSAKPGPKAAPSESPTSPVLTTLLVVGLMAASTIFIAYRYLNSGPSDAAFGGATPVSTPEETEPAAPEFVPAPQTAAGSPEPESATFSVAGIPEAGAATMDPQPASEQAAPAPPLGEQTTPASGTESGGRREALTPAERRAILGRGPMNPKERIEAMVAARRERGLPLPGDRASIGGQHPGSSSQRPARARVNLEVEASQSSTGPQVSALFGEILIDSHPYRRFMIRFGGGGSAVREKRVENIVLEGLPVSAREITVAVATDSGLVGERMEGSTRLSLQGEETNLSVSIRFFGQSDRSVRFR